MCGLTPFGVLGATNGDAAKFVLCNRQVGVSLPTKLCGKTFHCDEMGLTVSAEFLGDAAVGGRYGLCCKDVA